MGPNLVRSRTLNSLYISLLVRPPLKMGDCKRICHNFLFIWFSVCVCLCVYLLSNRIASHCSNQEESEVYMNPKPKEMLSLRLWIKHTIFLWKTSSKYFGIVHWYHPRTNKIKTIINILLDALLQKVCFGKPQTVGMYFLWVGTDGTMKEKLIWNYLHFFLVH